MTEKCKHEYVPEYEDHYAMGSIFYGYRCEKCNVFKHREAGPLELGTYK